MESGLQWQLPQLLPMNTIPQDQVAERNLERLAAQRQLYSDGKRVQAVHMILSVPLVIAWSLAVAAMPNLQVYAAAWGIVVALLDVVLFTPWQRSLKKQAARIQELFDCDVLQMSWNDIKIGRKPRPEAVKFHARRYCRSDPKCFALRDWYPKEVGKLPTEMARVVCQRTNSWWDADLRRRYGNAVLGMVVVLSVLVFLVGLIGGLTLEKLILAVLVPLLPAFLLGIRQFREHRDSAIRNDELRQHAEDFWDQAMLGETNLVELAKGSRVLQDEIYGNRCSSPLIFDWVYRRLRSGREDLMNKTAAELVAEAVNKR